MEQLVIGIVRSAHGLKGTFKVESTSGESAHFVELEEVTLRSGDRERVFAVESVDGCTANLLMKCVGIDTPEDAKKFSGWEIMVPKDMACPLYEDEFYIEDLKQCTLVYGLASDAPIEIGSVTGVLEGGESYLIEVSLSESFNLSQYVDSDNELSKGSKRFIPFKNEFIGTVDIKRKVIELMHLWILE